jgi:hypothetical protein
MAKLALQPALVAVLVVVHLVEDLDVPHDLPERPLVL